MEAEVFFGLCLVITALGSTFSAHPIFLIHLPGPLVAGGAQFRAVLTEHLEGQRAGGFFVLLTQLFLGFPRTWAQYGDTFFRAP